MQTARYTAESLKGINPAHTAHLLTNLHNQRDQLIDALRFALADLNTELDYECRLILDRAVKAAEGAA